MNINELIYEKKKKQEHSYSGILDYVKSYINEKYRNELSGNLTTEEAKERYKILIQQTIHDNKLYMAEYKEPELIELLYNSMVKYDFLTPYLEGGSDNLPDNELWSTWEEINCNRYDDIEVVIAGDYIKLNKGFDTPEMCVDIVRRLARLGNLTLDKSNPRGDSSIGNSIRMTATLPPCVDEEAGATFSIRRQKKITNDKDFFINNDTATEDELDFLLMGLNNGVPVGIAGNTGCGKTTDMNYLLRNVDKRNRIITIEDVRELDAVDIKDGKYSSRAIHFVTKKCDDEKQAVTAEDLVRDALRYDPDIIGLGEMRGKEAKPTIDAGCTGHTLLTGLHAASQKGAYKRMTTLYMDAATYLTEKMVYENIIEAIPIIVHKKAFKSGERRYMSISEAFLSQDLLNPQITFNTIFRFYVKDFERDKEGNLIKVIGEHRKVGNISNSLAQRLFENGVPLEEIRRFASPEFKPDEGKEERGL